MNEILAGLLLAATFASALPAAAQTAPVLVGASSRKVHGAAGTFDVPLSLTLANPSTEPRQGPSQTVVFIFDKPVTAGTASVTEGTATPGAPAFSGNEMIVPLGDVGNLQYVTVAVSNVAAADGGIVGTGSVRVGYLAGDVNQNRVVALSDLGQVNAEVAQLVTTVNFLKDVNASGTLSLADKGLTNVQLTKALGDPVVVPDSQPHLAPGIAGVLEKVVTDAVSLPRVDGLAFDRFGNLFAALEVVSLAGGAVYIDKATGAVTTIALGIPAACRLDVHPNGDLYVSSELPIVNVGGIDIQLGGIYRVVLSYGAGNRPVGGVATRLSTVLENPEGIQPLPANSAYGNAGEMFVAEDKDSGRIVRILPDGSGLTEWVGAAANLRKPEGLAFGDFNGARSPALYGAEKAGGRIFRIGDDGSVTTLGDPLAIGGLNGPDNIAFGPDGYLYVGEKYGGRIVRIDGNGVHTVYATGFDNVEGVAFDPTTGDLYIGEIEKSTVWRVRQQ